MWTQQRHDEKRDILTDLPRQEFRLQPGRLGRRVTATHLFRTRVLCAVLWVNEVQLARRLDLTVANRSCRVWSIKWEIQLANNGSLELRLCCGNSHSEYIIMAECWQFWLCDENADIESGDWTTEGGRDLLAVGQGSIFVRNN